MLISIVSPELFDAFPRRHPGMTVWEMVLTGVGGAFVPLKGGERVSEICVGDDKFESKVGMGSQPTKAAQEIEGEGN